MAGHLPWSRDWDGGRRLSQRPHQSHAVDVWDHVDVDVWAMPTPTCAALKHLP